MQDRKKLIERVRKLYAMSQATESSPNEAEIAARRVEALRAKHGITEAELATSEFASDVLATAKKMARWMDWLCLSVARVNDCKLTKGFGAGTQRSDGIWMHETTMTFKGFAEDVVLAQLQLDYLLSQMDRNWEEYKATLARSSKAINSSFKRGYAAQMANRLNALADERMEAVNDNGNALVPMKMAMVAEKFGVQKTSKRKGPAYKTDGGAYYAGRDAADRTGINGEIARA